MTYYKILLGGLISASISYIGTYLSPLLGAIWWSFPISLIPTIYFMKKVVSLINLLRNSHKITTYALILLLITCFFCHIILKNQMVYLFLLVRRH